MLVRGKGEREGGGEKVSEKEKRRTEMSAMPRALQ
jgi:hypothetical protein